MENGSGKVANDVAKIGKANRDFRQRINQKERKVMTKVTNVVDFHMKNNSESLKSISIN